MTATRKLAAVLAAALVLRSTACFSVLGSVMLGSFQKGIQTYCTSRRRTATAEANDLPITIHAASAR
jgi:hypothetical protein